MSSCTRNARNPRIFTPPSTLDEALDFVTELASRPNARIVAPGTDHLAILEQVCRDSAATGKLVADAQHAAVAIEHGCTLVTTDADFDRFRGVRWLHPLRPPEPRR